MLFRCYRQGLRIVEVPVVLSLRQSGESKISRVEILRALSSLARLSRLRFHLARSGSAPVGSCYKPPKV
jgi:hypothetical protein